MKTLKTILFGITLTLFFSGICLAQETVKKEAPKEDDDSYPFFIPPEKPVFEPDVVFDRQVAMDQLTLALETRDTPLLADIAIQLLLLEKNLGRNHLSGITGESVLKKVTDISVANRDIKTLERLVGVLEKNKDTANLDRLKPTLELVKTARAVDPLKTRIEKLPEEQRLRILEIQEKLESAKLFSDAKSFPEIEKSIRELTNTPADLAKVLREKLETTKSSIGKNESAADELLFKLAGPSRGATHNMKGKYGNQYKNANGERLVTFIVEVVGLDFTYANAKAAAAFGKDYIKSNKISLPTSIESFTVCDRSSYQRWAVGGWFNMDRNSSPVWVAGTDGGTTTYFAKTGGFLNAGATSKTKGTISYINSLGESRSSSDTWYRMYNVKDPTTGYKMGICIGCGIKGNVQIGFVGPK